MSKMSLREYANSWLKKKGTTAAKAKKSAGKYKNIAAAKKAGSLYYTNKDGKVMLAVYAEDLKKASSPKPKLRPKSDKPKADSKAPKQPKTETTASKTPARSTQDSKAATARRSSPQRPSPGQKDLPAVSISAARVKAKENIEAGKKATGSPVTPTTNKTTKMGNTPIREGSYVGKPAKSGAKPSSRLDTKGATPKQAFGPTFAEWRKKNKGGIVAYRKDMEKKGLKPRTSAGNK